MVARHHVSRDGRGSASPLRHASDEGALPHPQEPAAETQVKAMELQVQELYRDGPGQGLPPEALHGGAAQAPVRQGLAARASDEDRDEGSDRPDEEAQGNSDSESKS